MSLTQQSQDWPGKWMPLVQCFPG